MPMTATITAIAPAASFHGNPPADSPSSWPNVGVLKGSGTSRRSLRGAGAANDGESDFNRNGATGLGAGAGFGGSGCRNATGCAGGRTVATGPPPGCLEASGNALNVGIGIGTAGGCTGVGAGLGGAAFDRSLSRYPFLSRRPLFSFLFCVVWGGGGRR